MSGAGCGSPVIIIRSPPRSLSEAFCALAVDQHIALVDEQLHARAAHAFELRGQKLIEALAARFGGHVDGARLHSCTAIARRSGSDAVPHSVHGFAVERVGSRPAHCCGLIAFAQHQRPGEHQQHRGNLRAVERALKQRAAARRDRATAR